MLRIVGEWKRDGTATFVHSTGEPWRSVHIYIHPAIRITRWARSARPIKLQTQDSNGNTMQLTQDQKWAASSGTWTHNIMDSRQMHYQLSCLAAQLAGPNHTYKAPQLKAKYLKYQGTSNVHVKIDKHPWKVVHIHVAYTIVHIGVVPV